GAGASGSLGYSGHRLPSDTWGSISAAYTYANAMAATTQSGSTAAKGIAPALALGLGAVANGPARGVLTNELGAQSAVGFNTLGDPVTPVGPDGGSCQTRRAAHGQV